MQRARRPARDPRRGDTFAFLDPAYDGATALARNLARVRSWYEFAVPDIGRSPIAERGLAWLEANLPATPEAVLCWGDARIGNVLYRDFEPVGVLDWEMATVGPREMDVSWIVFAHQVFESITGMLEMPGMPHFMREEDVVASYEAADRRHPRCRSTGTTSTTASSGASSSCAPAHARSTSARSTGPRTSRRSSTTSRCSSRVLAKVGG